jgi:hypothetical protein
LCSVVANKAHLVSKIVRAHMMCRRVPLCQACSPKCCRLAEGRGKHVAARCCGEQLKFRGIAGPETGTVDREPKRQHACMQLCGRAGRWAGGRTGGRAGRRAGGPAGGRAGGRADGRAGGRAVGRAGGRAVAIHRTQRKAYTDICDRDDVQRQLQITDAMFLQSKSLMWQNALPGEPF